MKKKAKRVFEFSKIDWLEFERLNLDSTAYIETEIDGKSVMVLMSGENCVGIYYQRAGFASVCKDFEGDEVCFAEADKFWPYN